MNSIPKRGTEREQLATLLRKSRDMYLLCLKGVSEAAALVRLSESSWSILQVAEHVAAAEHGMLRAVEVGTEKATPPNYAADDEILKRGASRENRLQAPERALPKGRWTSLSEAVEAFEKSRARSLEFVEKSAKELRKIEFVHPLMGTIDGHQAFLIMAAHAERHAAQIEEIKRTQAYRNAAGK